MPSKIRQVQANVNLTRAANTSHAIILISDGFPNRGYPTPTSAALNAAKRAAKMGIPIYTIHLSAVRQDSNPELLKKIAEDSGGKFMRVGNIDELREVLTLIGKYYVPPHPWSVTVAVRTTIPTRRSLMCEFILATVVLLAALWVGYYWYYKTSF